MLQTFFVSTLAIHRYILVCILLAWPLTILSQEFEFKTPEPYRKAFTYNWPGTTNLAYLGPLPNNPKRYQIKFNSKEYIMFDGVIGPDYHSAQLFEFAQYNHDDKVLEIGTGIGVQAIAAAQISPKIVATDIDPVAVENARFNANLHRVENRIDFRAGDLFALIDKTEEFDVILFNVIYPYNDQTQHHWALHDKFFSQVKNYLSDNGRIYYQAGYLDNLNFIRKMLSAYGLKIHKMEMRDLSEYNRQPMVFEIRKN